MKKNLVLFLLLMILIPCTVSATTGTVYCPDDDSPLNIRDKIGGTPIAGAACNSQLEIINNNAGSTVDCTKWFKVEYNGTTGYSCGSFIKENILEKGYVMCEENDEPLTFRSSVGGTLIKKLPCDTEVEIIDKNAGSTSGCSKWYKIKHDGIEGYGCGNYLSPTKANTTSPTISTSTTPSNYVVEDDSYDKNRYNTRAKDGTIMCYEDSGDLSLKNTPYGTKTGSISCGEAVTIEETVENDTNSKCDYYYKVNTGSKSGYVCGYFVNTTKLTPKAEKYYSDNGNKESYTNELKNKGFPDSYIPYLLEIHARHPNWKFTAENVNKDFTSAVIGESGNGTSLIEATAFAQGYYSMKSNTYDIQRDLFSYYPNEGYFLNASQEAIAYFMDPRNYLNYRYIFAFETLGFSENQNAYVVNDVIKSQAFWNNLYSNGSIGASDEIVNASRDANISPLHVAARIKQEVSGLTTSDSRLGGIFTYNGNAYSGYYNFFNIKSNCSNCSSIYAGYAFEHGWNTPFKGIYGGASFMAANYIAINQDTLYYEKFDVSRANGSYTHQYMQNVAATFQEGGAKYRGYVDGNKSYLDTAIEFVIPIYSNMSNYAVTAPNIGNPNNYLNDLRVNGTTISGFNYLVQNYDVTLESNVTSVTITANNIGSKATISGTGTFNINSNSQTSTIIVRAENGKTREYVINFTRKESQNNNPTTEIKVEDVIKTTGYKYSSNEISGINLNTDASTLLNKVSEYGNGIQVSLKDSSNNNVSSGILKTGYKLTITTNTETKQYDILIFGDPSGDGKITSLDYVKIKNHILNRTALSGVYYNAADIDKNGSITSLDYVKIKNHILGRTTISQ